MILIIEAIVFHYFVCGSWGGGRQ